MTKKHTQGKWQIHKPDFETINIVTDNSFICEIPRSVGVSEENEQMNIEAEANAKLIAAAPKLLEACFNALSQITNHESGQLAQFQKVEDMLNDAINLATN